MLAYAGLEGLLVGGHRRRHADSQRQPRWYRCSAATPGRSGTAFSPRFWRPAPAPTTHAKRLLHACTAGFRRRDCPLSVRVPSRPRIAPTLSVLTVCGFAADGPVLERRSPTPAPADLQRREGACPPKHRATRGRRGCPPKHSDSVRGGLPAGPAVALLSSLPPSLSRLLASALFTYRGRDGRPGAGH